MKTLLWLLAAITLAAIWSVPARGQCRIGANGQMQCSPSSGASYSYSAPQAQSFTASDGTVYELQPQYGRLGWYRGHAWVATGSTQVVTAATPVPKTTDPHPCACGCDLTGQCVCRSCNAGTGFPEAKKVTAPSFSATSPVAATPKGTAIDPKELREVAPDPEMAWYQDRTGSMFYLNREAVKNSKMLIASGKWIWQANQ